MLVGVEAGTLWEMDGTAQCISIWDAHVID